MIKCDLLPIGTKTHKALKRGQELVMTAFLGIYKAVFQYEPQSDEELAIDEGDMLYLLQKSDVDDWWTVKKRVIGSDAEEPVGLVPNNYIEEADILYTAKAVYDYPEVQNPEEELAFSENDSFDVFDDRDSDWILCRSQKTGEFGFVPGNYIEVTGSSVAAGQGTSASVAPAPAPAASAPALDASSFPPPPQHMSRASVQPSSNTALPPTPPESPQAEDIPPPRPARPEVEDEEYAPPKPTRPTNTESTPDRRRSAYSGSYGDDDEVEDLDLQETARSESKTGSFNTWDISEVDGRKKRKAKIAIGRDTIFFTPSKGTPQQWPIQDLMTYDNEKKHIFFEFTNPYLNLEIHTGSTDVANEIMAVLGEVKGAYHASGLREVEAASKAPAKSKKASSKSSNRKQGKVVYDFIGESGDELTITAGQIVNILDDKKSKDWWMCELPETGKKGVVPAQFVEPINQLSFMAGSLKGLRKSSRSGTPTASKDWKQDDDQEVSKKSSARKRASSFLHKKKDGEKSSSKKHKDFPDSSKTRIWVDRSGTFRVEAEFIGCVDGKIHLHKANGVKIAVAADKLCQEDLELVERMTGMSLDKYKPKNTTSNSSSSARDKERDRRRRLKEQEDRERELEQRERDRKLREQELIELRRARDLLDKERENLRASQERELPPIKPPRPNTATASSSERMTPKSASKPEYDWFEFFLNCGVDVNNCQRYTINFEREQIAEEILPDIQPSLLRTLGLREGDIIRVMKYLDQKFGRQSSVNSNATGGLFSEPDGSLKVSQTGIAANSTGALSSNLLPQQPNAQASNPRDDDAWTVKPAAKLETKSPHQTSEFTGSMQDLLDLQPLEPKRTANAAPQPNIKDLEAVKTGASKSDTAIQPEKTGASLVPLDPFKTGGHNLLPMATGGFVMVPVSTGGLVPLQRTGGMFMPQTTFGMQPTGTVLPVQKTGSGLIPVNTGGLLPQTTFGLQGSSSMMPLNRTGGTLPLQQGQMTGSLLPQTTSLSTMGLQRTGGTAMVPQTTFGMNPNPMPLSLTGGASMPLQRTGGGMPFSMQATGITGSMPQTSFGNQITGGANIGSQTGFGSQFTGGPSIMPSTTFTGQATGGANLIPSTSFGNQFTGGVNIMPQQTTGVYGGILQPAMGSAQTGGFGTMPQNSFNMGSQMSGQRTGGMVAPYLAPTQTGGFQPQSQFGLGLQRTGGLNSYPQTSFSTGGPMQQPLGAVNTGGINQLNGMFQNTSISQPTLQSQPTGFGFGNGPQPYQKQANLHNASADNPFGF